MILLQNLAKNRNNQFVLFESSKTVVVFCFFSFYEKKMVGIIHPFSIGSRDLPHFPIYDLVWIAWNHHRGEADHFKDCVVCRHIGEWCLDLIWSKWNHKHYIKYNEFIYNLIYTDAYDRWMNRTPSCDLEQMNIVFFGFQPW